MKGTLFSKPLEWNLETIGESWQQGDTLKGILKVINHGSEPQSLSGLGVALAYADIKKVHARVEGALKHEASLLFQDSELGAGKEALLNFSFNISPNGTVTDKKTSYYLGFGKNLSEGQLQVKVEPKKLYSMIVGLLDTFYRFKIKEIKGTPKGVEFKLIPPTSRDMANIETLNLLFSMHENNLDMTYNFQIKKLDTASTVTKICKENITVQKRLSPKEYSLGKDMINQDQLLRNVESAIAEVKLKRVF